MSKEKYLDRNRQTSVQYKHRDENELGPLVRGRRDDGVEISHEEDAGYGQADCDEDVIHDVNR